MSQASPRSPRRKSHCRGPWRSTRVGTSRRLSWLSLVAWVEVDLHTVASGNCLVGAQRRNARRSCPRGPSHRESLVAFLARRRFRLSGAAAMAFSMRSSPERKTARALESRVSDRYSELLIVVVRHGVAVELEARSARRARAPAFPDGREHPPVKPSGSSRSVAHLRTTRWSPDSDETAARNNSYHLEHVLRSFS